MPVRALAHMRIAPLTSKPTPLTSTPCHACVSHALFPALLFCSTRGSCFSFLASSPIIILLICLAFAFRYILQLVFSSTPLLSPPSSLLPRFLQPTSLRKSSPSRVRILSHAHMLVQVPGIHAAPDSLGMCPCLWSMSFFFISDPGCPPILCQERSTPW